MTTLKTPLCNATDEMDDHLQRAAGQLACARDLASILQPKPLEMVTRLQSMVNEAERMQQEVSDYAKRNSAQLVAVGTIKHDGIPAHDCTRITTVERQTSFNYCSFCGYWFEPVKIVSESRSI